METLNSWITTALEWIDMIPIQGWAVMTGLFIGMVSTQWIKRTFPIHILFPQMERAVQKMYIRIFALILSFLPTYFIWPGTNAVWAAIAVGFGTPSIYHAGSFFVYKKWPELRGRFSGTKI